MEDNALLCSLDEKSMELGDYGTIDCGAGRKWLLESSNLVLGFEGQNLTSEEL